MYVSDCVFVYLRTCLRVCALCLYSCVCVYVFGILYVCLFGLRVVWLRACVFCRVPGWLCVLALYVFASLRGCVCLFIYMVGCLVVCLCVYLFDSLFVLVYVCAGLFECV